MRSFSLMGLCVLMKYLLTAEEMGQLVSHFIQDHVLILLTEIGTSPTGNGEHLPLDQRRLSTLVGQANGHNEVCEGYGMLQTYDGNVVVLVIGVLFVFGMHMYVLEGNVQCSIRTAQIVRFLNAVGLRLHIELAQSHMFTGSKGRLINLVLCGTRSTYSPRRSRTPSPCTQWAAVRM